MQPTRDSVTSMDLLDYLDEIARQTPQAPFLHGDGPTLTYAQLQQRSVSLAAVLRSRGAIPGDRVVAQVEKSPEAVLLYIACLRAGAVFVPINTASTIHELDYFVRDSQPRIIVVKPDRRDSIAPTITAAGVSHIETLGEHRDGSLLELERASTAKLNSGASSFEPGSLASIVYTSGTTGRAKGAMLTRANLASNAAALSAIWRFNNQDVLLHVLPLFHIHGLFAAINTVLVSGASVRLQTRFDPVQAIERFSDATVFMGVPTHYTRLLQEARLDRSTTAHMRLFVSGSAPLLSETHQEFRRRTGQEILERYGMTETLINTSNPYDGPRIPGAVGLPLPGIELRVAATEGTGTPESDQVGALEVRGPNVFAGYWRDPEKTRAEFTADGWFKTGDLGRIDSDGYVYIVGRAKDLVITGGYNVYPKEVERELDSLDGIVESAVFGVPHPDFGEGVTAAVVLHPGSALAEQAIIELLQTKLARYKIPKRIVALSELPRNAMGKVQKNLLRKQFASLYTGT